MAVGKGSMARAAKAAEESADKAPAKNRTKKSVAKATGPTEKKTVVTAETVAAPSEEVLRQIIYQRSDGILERDAKPNESFGLGDAMPVYYF